jgi:hypothetical protein
MFEEFKFSVLLVLFEEFKFAEMLLIDTKTAQLCSQISLIRVKPYLHLKQEPMEEH